MKFKLIKIHLDIDLNPPAILQNTESFSRVSGTFQDRQTDRCTYGGLCTMALWTQWPLLSLLGGHLCTNLKKLTWNCAPWCTTIIVVHKYPYFLIPWCTNAPEDRQMDADGRGRTRTDRRTDAGFKLNVTKWVPTWHKESGRSNICTKTTFKFLFTLKHGVFIILITHLSSNGNRESTHNMCVNKGALKHFFMVNNIQAPLHMPVLHVVPFTLGT